MIYKIKTYIIFFSIFVSIIFTGCLNNDSDKQYYNAAKQFNKIYFDTVKNLEAADAMKTIEQLQTENSKQNIEELGKLLELIKKNIPKDREKLYQNFKERYEDFVFLKDSYSKFNKLSKDEKRKIGIVLVNVGMNIENWKDKKSTIIWE